MCSTILNGYIYIINKLNTFFDCIRYVWTLCKRKSPNCLLPLNRLNWLLYVYCTLLITTTDNSTSGSRENCSSSQNPPGRFSAFTVTLETLQFEHRVRLLLDSFYWLLARASKKRSRRTQAPRRGVHDIELLPRYRRVLVTFNYLVRRNGRANSRSCNGTRVRTRSNANQHRVSRFLRQQATTRERGPRPGRNRARNARRTLCIEAEERIGDVG